MGLLHPSLQPTSATSSWFHYHLFVLARSFSTIFRGVSPFDLGTSSSYPAQMVLRARPACILHLAVMCCTHCLWSIFLHSPSWCGGPLSPLLILWSLPLSSPSLWLVFHHQPLLPVGGSLHAMQGLVCPLMMALFFFCCLRWSLSSSS